MNGLPFGYEPSELPVLHSASNSVGPFIFHTAHRYIGGRGEKWRKAEVVLPNGCPFIPLRTGAWLLPG